MNHRIHVIKVPTTDRTLFPYSHYADAGHDPRLQVKAEGTDVVLECDDVFKLKPNVQQRPLNRIDIYLPGDAAEALALDIVALAGPGDVPALAGVDPEASRQGRQTLPVIRETRAVSYKRAGAQVAGMTAAGENGTVYVDNELPNEGHFEMKGPEIHLGIPLDSVRGTMDLSTTREVTVDPSELRVAGETNPIRKAAGRVGIRLDQRNAARLAAALLKYGSTAP